MHPTCSCICYLRSHDVLVWCPAAKSPPTVAALHDTPRCQPTRAPSAANADAYVLSPALPFTYFAQAVMEIIRSHDTSAGVVDVELEDAAADEAAGEDDAHESAGQPSSSSNSSSPAAAASQQNGAAEMQASMSQGNGVQQQRQQQQIQPPPQQDAAGTGSSSQAAAAAAAADALAVSAAQKLGV